MDKTTLREALLAGYAPFARRFYELGEVSYALLREQARSVLPFLRQSECLPDTLSEIGRESVDWAQVPRPVREDTDGAGRALSAHLHGQAGAACRAAFALVLYEMAAEAGIPLDASRLLSPAPPSEARIACFKTPYTNEAYEEFAAHLTAPTVLYVSSYREGCEAVRAGEAGYCILPYENSEGVLTTFADMAARYGLVRVDNCRVFHTDGTDATRFSLFCRRFPEIPEGDGGLALTYSFTCPAEGLSEHLSGLSALSLTPARATAVRGAGEGGRLSVTLTVHTGHPVCLEALLIYLYMFAEDLHFLGLYKENDL